MKKVSQLLLATTAIVSFAFISPRTIETKQINIVIDAGHGGNDHGATTNEFTEKEIVKDITNKINLLNKNENVVIHLTRAFDESVSLQDRTDFINRTKPDLVLSLHVNQSANNNSASGMEFYISKDNATYEKSKEIAGKLSSKLTENNNFKSKGVKDASFMLLKKSECPAVLVELGFLSNENDRKYLTDENEQNKIAESIVSFLSELK